MDWLFCMARELRVLNSFGGSMTWNRVVCFRRVETIANGRFQLCEGGLNLARKTASQLGADGGSLFQRGNGILYHRPQVQASRSLVQHPQRLRVIGIEFRKAVAGTAAESPPLINSSGLETGTARADRAGPPPDEREDPLEFQVPDEPPAQHDLSRCGGQSPHTHGVIRIRSSNAQLSFSNNNRSAKRRRAPASLQRIPACRKRACTTCLCALSTAPLPIP